MIHNGLDLELSTGIPTERESERIGARDIFGTTYEYKL